MTLKQILFSIFSEEGKISSKRIGMVLSIITLQVLGFLSAFGYTCDPTIVVTIGGVAVGTGYLTVKNKRSKQPKDET